VSLGELAALLEGEACGDESVRIVGVAGLKDAAAGTIVRVEHPRYLEAAEAGGATALLTDQRIGPLVKPAIRVPQVRDAYSRCLALFAPSDGAPEGVHPTAVIASDAELGEGCAVGAYAVIGRRARIGAGVTLYPQVVVGEDVEIGPGCVIFPHVTLYAHTVLGARVRIHSGSVVGADGFGYEWDGKEHRKIPQIGRVRIGDDVEIGASSSVDRATAGETVIGPGTKIDNQVQVGHNVRTGAHCLLVSQSGLAGTVELGNGVVVAGKAGVKDHVNVGDGAQIGGGAAVWSDLAAGARVSGAPARPHRDQIRLQAALGQVPALLKRVAELERLLGATREGRPETPAAE
jgi:UDP-3-O-[3-hydroxymyristoyl] glucosamine N-acyltransferase